MFPPKHLKTDTTDYSPLFQSSGLKVVSLKVDVERGRERERARDM
jgi:hypothetical protein